MAGTAANRATFINSLLSFMQNYGFDGVDLDWEYPVADDRGGQEADKQNYVLLVKEMKIAFRGRYGAPRRSSKPCHPFHDLLISVQV
jgi:chitinase